MSKDDQKLLEKIHKYVEKRNAEEGPKRFQQNRTNEISDYMSAENARKIRELNENRFQAMSNAQMREYNEVINGGGQAPLQIYHQQRPNFVPTFNRQTGTYSMKG